jgi:Flp pilus assembly protein TadG
LSNRRLRCTGDRRGVAALEFALLACVLVPALLTVFDLGSAIYETSVLRQAIRDGALYALYYNDTPGIVSTIEASMPAGWTDASVYASGWAPATSCVCMDGSGNPSAAPSCSCSSGATVERLMTLTVSRPFSPVFIRSITQVSATDVIRYQ